MALRRRALKKIKGFSLPVSYRVNETKDRLRDAKNVFSNQGRLETRYGYSRYNATTMSNTIRSLSFFKETNGTGHVLAKSDEILYKVATSGASTSLKTGLTSTTKHRGVTMNNRHIIAIESDGIFQYDSTNGVFELGQAVPSAPTVANSGSGNTLPASDYRVRLTFYSTVTGFETNGGAQSTTVTVGAGEQIDVTDIPGTAANETIDKVRVYVQDVTGDGEFLFWEEIDLGTTTNTVDEEITSAQTPPTTHASPSFTNAKYLAVFNRRLVASGNSTYPNGVWFSEQDLPDAWDDTATQNRLFVAGDGPITGIGVGYYNNSVLDPYLVIFKKRSTHVYSEVGDSPKLVLVDDSIGCVSHDTIRVRDGNLMFLSANGWRAITNGFIAKDEKGESITLGGGDIDDIFKSSGYVYELNKSQFANFFSVYYRELDQYLTWTAEGSNTSINRIYNFEFECKGFKPYVFQIPATCACVAEDGNGKEIVLFGNTSGFVHKHSINESRTDVDVNNSSVAIEAFAHLTWMDGDDYDCSYNFRELLIRAINSSNTLTVKAFINFDITNSADYDYSFPDPNSGFQLDVSRLDEGIFSDDRAIVTSRADLNRVGENILIAFYQQIEGANINLISAQLNFSKNGNRN